MKVRGIVASLGLALAVVIGITATAQAHQGFWLGGGFGSMSASGDMNGSSSAFFTDASGTNAVEAGSLSSGTGLVLDIGYGFNKYLGIEYLFSQTHHSASSTVVGTDTTANVSTGLLALRVTVPLEEQHLELFGRVGLSSHSVTYADYGLQGFTSGNVFKETSSGSATFTGSGTGIGFGVEYFIDKVGLELGYTLFQANMNQASTSSFSGGLSPVLKENFGLVDLDVSYHF